jgi:S-formylglutathione hydrolase FrmB
MAFIQCDCFSEALGMCISMDVVLPQATQRQIGMTGAVRGERHPTLYLLHGLSDDHSIWMRRTSIERHVAEAGLAVIMPCVHRSFYTDMVHGYKYWTFISEEVIELAQQFFPLSPKREDRFVAGLSMGGYGAFKLAMHLPEKFAAGASLSGAVDMASRDNADLREDLRNDLTLVYGGPEKIAGTEHDLMHVAAELAGSKGPRPKLYQWCGTDDFLYPQNLSFRDHAQKLGLDLTYEEGSGGHEWSCWDRQIQRVIEWLPLGK